MPLSARRTPLLPKALAAAKEVKVIKSIVLDFIYFQCDKDSFGSSNKVCGCIKMRIDIRGISEGIFRHYMHVSKDTK